MVPTAAALFTALLTIGGTVFVGFLAVASFHPLFVAPAVTGSVVITLLIWSCFRVTPAERRR